MPVVLFQPLNTSGTTVEKGNTEQPKPTSVSDSTDGQRRDGLVAGATEESSMNTSTADRHSLPDKTVPASVAAVNSACTVESLVNAKYSPTMPVGGFLICAI